MTARSRLKAATADRHDTLDRGFAQLDLTKRQDYRRFLEAQAAILAPLEEWLKDNGISQILPDWPQRRRAAALAADLAGLDGDTRPQPLRMPAPSSAMLLGVTYVLEGSRLGARYLARIVGDSADEAVRGNMRFLEHGSGGKLWPSFLSALEAGVAGDNDIREAADGARRTFDLFLAAQRDVTAPAATL